MEIYALSALVTLTWYLAFKLGAVERRVSDLEAAGQGHPDRRIRVPPRPNTRRRLLFR